MADEVLRHRRGMAEEPREARRRGDPERGPQIVARAVDELVVAAIDQRRVQRAAEEAADQHVAGGRATGILHARERRGEELAAFGARHDEAERVERVGDVFPAIAERDGRRGRVRDVAKEHRDLRVDIAQEPRCAV